MARVLVPRRVGWIPSAIIGGFVSTIGTVIGLCIAYAVAVALGRSLGGVIGGWFVGLTRNPITLVAQNAVAGALLLHFCFGIIWASIYAAIFEPRLSGPGWQRGMQFSLIPWILSLTVFFPLVGGGFLGVGLGAGPLPIVGNLILHLLYGAILGEVYALGDLHFSQDDWYSPRDRIANAGAEQGVAIGVIAGAALGAAAALVASGVLALAGSQDVSPVAFALVGAAFGMFTGALVGSFLGMGNAQGS